jgi:hypothetical protein
VAVAIGLLAWTVRTLATRGPRDVAGEPPPVRVALTAELRLLADQAAAAEEKYHELAARKGNEAAAEAILSRAISLQQELLRRNRQAGPEHARRLERLEEARDTLRARASVGRITALEAAAGDAPATAESLEALREALILQQEINRSAASPRLKDFVRETRLAQRLEAAEAGPLRATADAALREAEAAAKEQDWTSALPAYERARRVLAEINQRFPRSRQADIGLLERITTEMVSLEAAAAALEVEAREKGAEAAEAAGQGATAAELYLSAGKIQLDINRRFARSRFASTQRADQLEARRQTVLARELQAQAARLDREADRLIFKRQLLASAAKVDKINALLAESELAYPKSRADPGTLRIKHAYLDLRRAVQASLQDQVYASSIPVPGVKNLLMLRTEVPQHLYASLMSYNPSRQAGANLPVDSVDWAGAQEFCQRLSWLLGTRVRLPTELEYRQAVGEGLQDAWTAEGSAGQARATGSLPANANGFCDLLGNVAEWLQQPAEDVAAEATVAGGSYLDVPVALQTVPMTRVEKTKRARHIGFRVVVEYPLE